MTQFFLHIGTHKTGTTYLQRVLFANRAKLLSSGYLYPESAIQSPLLTGHHFLPWALEPNNTNKKNATASHRAWESLLEEVDSHPGKKIITSSEEFCSLQPPSIRKIAELLSGFDVRILVYLRRQDHFLLSMFSEQAKKGSYAKPVEVLARQKERFDYYAMLEAWAQVFGQNKLTVRVYENQQMTNGLLPDFFESTGIGAAAESFVLADQTFNKAIDGRTLKLIRLLNLIAIKHLRLSPQVCRNLYVERLQYPRFQRILAGLPRSLVSDEVLSREAVRSIVASFDDMNARVAREYLGRDNGRLFYEPLP